MHATTESPAGEDPRRRGKHRRKRPWGVKLGRRRLAYQRGRVLRELRSRWTLLALALLSLGGIVGSAGALYLEGVLESMPERGGWERAVPTLVFVAAVLFGLLLFGVALASARWRVLDKQVKANQRESLRIARFLSDATLLLASSLSPTTLEQLARRAVPLMGKGCAICLLDETGKSLRLTIAHRDPEKERTLRAIYDGPISVSGQEPLLEGIAEARIGRLPEKVWEALIFGGLDPEVRGTASAILKGSVAIPVVARGRPLGLLVLTASPEHRNGPRNLWVWNSFGLRLGLAIDNTRLLHEAKHAIQIREDFLSIASHELRTPLTALQANLQGMLRAMRNGAVSAERHQKSLELSERQAHRLAKLVYQLLDVSRIAAGKLQPEKETFDLADLVVDMTARYREEAARVGTSIDVAAEPATGTWDRNQLEQVFTNLLSNAIKYGGGGPITVSLEDLGQRARLRVRDEGPGIPADAQMRIFDRFERALSGQHHAGLGLGLYIVREIVLAHGGKVEVRSAAGEGSTFTVELPKSCDLPGERLRA